MIRLNADLLSCEIHPDRASMGAAAAAQAAHILREAIELRGGAAEKISS